MGHFQDHELRTGAALVAYDQVRAEDLAVKDVQHGARRLSLSLSVSVVGVAVGHVPVDGCRDVSPLQAHVQ